jgi:hypothetical protein
VVTLTTTPSARPSTAPRVIATPTLTGASLRSTHRRGDSDRTRRCPSGERRVGPRHRPRPAGGSRRRSSAHAPPPGRANDEAATRSRAAPSAPSGAPHHPTAHQRDGGNRLAAVHEQGRQERASARAPEHDSTPVMPDLERSKDAQLEHSPRGRAYRSTGARCDGEPALRPRGLRASGSAGSVGTVGPRVVARPPMWHGPAMARPFTRAAPPVEIVASAQSARHGRAAEALRGSTQ